MYFINSQPLLTVATHEGQRKAKASPGEPSHALAKYLSL